jgi:polyhydroxybutyrate depolymerase
VQKPLPLVVNFHGNGSTAGQQRQYSGMNVIADRYGFTVVYPSGTGMSPRQRQFLSFNAGGCCGAAMRNNVDDVGFTEAILSVSSERIEVDPGRIYATGMSNGGMMARRMAVEYPRIAAVASVAGQLALTSFRPSHPVSVMEFHRVDDRWARFGGRPGGSVIRIGYASVQRGIDQWVTHDECQIQPLFTRSCHQLAESDHPCDEKVLSPPPSRTPEDKPEDKRGNLRGVLFSGPGQVP